jgi:fatty acid desaturase
MLERGTSEMHGSRKSWEWPTLLLIGIVYTVIALLVWFHAALPWWIILPIGAYAAALHSSLQHEVLHGHPTRSGALNEALVMVSPTFWTPFSRYRDLHLAHHNDDNLTDPAKDPESFYLLPDDWAQAGSVKRALFNINQTLGGRMVIGPAVGMAQYWKEEACSVLRGDKRIAFAWLKFIVISMLTIAIITQIAGMPFWKFYLLVSYPGISLALVRSYCEHQAAEDIGERTIVVEASPFWSLLFLNNNLHIAHHSKPTMAWYRIPAYYREHKNTLVKRNGGYLMQGYGEIFWRYFFKAKEPVAYPNLDWLRQAPIPASQNRQL